jgi:gliding motility-associated-like protein
MKLFFRILFLCISFNITYSQSTTCETASAMCSGQGGPYNNTNTGTTGGNQTGYGPITGCGGSGSHGNNGSLGSTPRPAWFYYTIGRTGPINLNLQQFNASNTGIDVDFALWGPFPDNNLGNICNSLSGFPGSTYTGPCNLVDASYSSTFNETIHIPNAQVGQIYLLLVTNFSGQPGTYTINQTNATAPGAGQISCDIVCGVDLGPDRLFCDANVNSLNLVANFNQAPTAVGSPVYSWYLYNGTTYVLQTTTSVNNLTVTQDGLWKVSVLRPGCSDIAEDDIEIRFDAPPVLNNPSNLDAPVGVCSHTFDLTQNQAALTAPTIPSNYNIRYYLSEDDCLAGNTNFITNPTSFTVTTTTTIFVRVENLDNAICSDATKFFDLVIQCNPLSCQLDLTSNTTTTNQTVCLNTPIQTIDYSYSGEATAANVTGLPTGVTAAISAGVVIISGSPSQAGVFNYSVASIGCTTNLTLQGTITVTDLPNVTSVTSNSPICSGSNAVFTITGTPNATVTYSLNGGATTTVILSNAGTQTVTSSNATTNQQLTVTLVSVNGCSRVVSVAGTVTVTQPIVSTFNQIPNLCIGANAPALPNTSTQNYTGSWSPATINTAAAGTFTYTFTPTTGQCAAPGSIQVTIDPLEITTFNPMPELCLNSSNNALPTQSIQGIVGTWNPSIINTTQLGTFTYTFTPASSECATPATMDVIVKACAIQKGISPNGDGLNDNFDLAGYNVSKIEIFNRYGTIVYSKNNYQDEWYGQSNNGNELPDGTYYYVINFTDKETITGWIYINREQ